MRFLYLLAVFTIIDILASDGQASIIGEMIRALLQWGKNDLEAEGVYYPRINNEGRVQRAVAMLSPFPCNIQDGRSPEPPKSVHRLRPGDIDVIGSLGDSLIAGSGALEEFAIGTFIEARGVSWCQGGQANWREYLTLPNIIKEFNPRLTGFSTGSGEFISRKARFNIAYPVAAAGDAVHQAKILVNRINSDPTIDVRNHWKMITILFGANDICSAQCYNPKEFSPARYAFHIRRALDYLRVTLPRTLVNLIPAIDVTISKRVPNRSMMCNVLHPLYCACMHKGNNPDIAASKMSALYQQAAEALVTSGRYDTTDDFTVVLQPFTKLFNAPKSNPARAAPIDKSLVTHDCFHFSQKGHALAANLLWNNLLEPVGNKTDRGMPRVWDKLLCPSNKRPFIFTNTNSKLFYRTGSQDPKHINKRMSSENLIDKRANRL